MSDAWPLIGRSGELRLAEASVRGARGVMLVGAAGVGKTRLAREVLEIARRRGKAVRWVTATASARATPLGAFASVLPSVGADHLGTLRQATRALLEGAQRSGTLIVVDDAHLLDDVSATLLHQVVTTPHATVLTTVRSDTPVPDAVAALWKDGHLDRIEVAALPQAETTTLLESVLGGPVQGATATRIWHLSGGNPLYLRELVTGGRADGWLEQRSGLWCWVGRLALPSTLVELVEARMGGLTEPVRDVVDLLAFAGELDTDVLAQLSGWAVLEQAETYGLITVAERDRQLSASLTHPLYGEVRQTRVGTLRARRLRGRIAQALIDRGLRGVDDELRCAALITCSDLAGDPELLTRAAARSAQLLDLPLAVRLARAALDAGGGFAAQAIVVQALSMQGWGAEAEGELLTLAELAGDGVERAWAAAIRAGNLFFDLNRPAEAERVLGSAMDAATEETAKQLLLALHAVFEGLLARPDGAIEAAHSVLVAGNAPANAVVLAAWGLTAAHATTGRVESMRPVAATAQRMAVSFDTAFLRFNVAELELMAFRLAGHVSEAAGVAARCRRDTADLPGLPQLFASALSGQAELARGCLAEATRCLAEALAGFTIVDPGGRVFDCLLWLTQALAMGGDASAAERRLGEMGERVQTGYAFRRPDVVLARAWVTAAGGLVAEAAGLAREAAELSASCGLPAHEVVAWETAVRFGAQDAGGRLAELEDRVDGPRAGIVARYADALAKHDGSALRDVSAALEAMGDLAVAADAAAHAAIAHTQARQSAAARACTRRVHQLARRCQGARTPAILSVTRQLPVTGRELEIVTLAARGLSNRDIATRLGVSVRTVEGHVYRAGLKLGVTHRIDFAELLWGTY